MSPPPAATLSSDSLLRATTRLQEAHEPARQKPIIKFEPHHQQNHLNQANQLAGSVRASIDSGRDNPFRPDGEIYKLTNPIVDYYKFGPNQSRSATPTYAELDYFSSKNKRKRRAAARKARGERRRSCWRRWFCCCCCGRSEPPQQVDGAGREQPAAGKPIESDLSATTTTNKIKATSLGAHKTKPKRAAKKQVQLGDETSAKELNTMTTKTKTTTTKTSQTNGADTNSTTAVKMVGERGSCDPTQTNAGQERPEGVAAASTTKVKTASTTSKRCVVS